MALWANGGHVPLYADILNDGKHGRRGRVFEGWYGGAIIRKNDAMFGRRYLIFIPAGRAAGGKKDLLKPERKTAR